MRGFALLKTLLAAFALGAALAGAPVARADDIEITDVRLVATEDGVVLAADFAFDLNPRLAEAVTNGVPLYFAVEFELTRPRWYWFDEKAAVKREVGRLAPRQRATFILKEIEGLETAEIARTLGVTESTVRNHLLQARRILREGLNRDYPGLTGTRGLVDEGEPS